MSFLLFLLMFWIFGILNFLALGGGESSFSLLSEEESESEELDIAGVMNFFFLQPEDRENLFYDIDY